MTKRPQRNATGHNTNAEMDADRSRDPGADLARRGRGDALSVPETMGVGRDDPHQPDRTTDVDRDGGDAARFRRLLDDAMIRRKSDVPRWHMARRGIESFADHEKFVSGARRLCDALSSPSGGHWNGNAASLSATSWVRAFIKQSDTLSRRQLTQSLKCDF